MGKDVLSWSMFQGNYDTYVQTRAELEENQMKKYRWEQDQIAHMKVPMLLRFNLILEF